MSSCCVSHSLALLLPSFGPRGLNANVSHFSHINTPPVSILFTAHTRPSIPRSLFRRDQVTFYSTSYVPPTPRRSFPRRVFNTIVIATLSIVAGSMAGTYPMAHVIAHAVRKPFSDKDTLTLFNPPDSESEYINEYILNHPLITTLRAEGKYTESRPHLKIQSPFREHTLLAGTLSGPGRVVVPPLHFAEPDGRSSISIFYLGEDICGHPGIVHGGLLATLLDEGLARCCFPALPKKIAVTASLNVNYRKPAPAGNYFVLRAETTKVEGRKAWVKGRIESLPEYSLPEMNGYVNGEAKIVNGVPLANGQEAKGNKGVVLYTEAEALFVEPKDSSGLPDLLAHGDKGEDAKEAVGLEIQP